MKTILCIRASSIGDVAMTVPILRAFTLSYPDIRIVMLTAGFLTPFFEKIPNLVVFPIDLKSKHKGVKGIMSLYNQLTSEYTFDAVLDLHNKLYSKLLLRLFVKNSIPLHRINKGRKEKKDLIRVTHKILTPLKSTLERYLDVFMSAGFTIPFSNVRTHSERPLPKSITLGNNSSIGLAPFAQYRGKILPLDIVRNLVSLISSRYPETKIFLFGGGQVERIIADSLCAWYPNCESVIGKISLGEELDLMSHLDCVISMDSAAMHMASLVGASVVSIWGQTHYYAGFLGFGQSAEDIVSCELSCRPCSVFGNKPCYRKDYACLHGISPEAIVKKLSKHI